MSITREQLETASFTWSDSDIDLEAPCLPPVHPGEVLRTEFMEPNAITGYRLAADIHVPNSRIIELTKGRRSMTADTALRLGRYFGTSAAFWMNLQTAHDLEAVERVHGREIEAEVSSRV